MITVLGSLNYDLIVHMARFPLAGETIMGRDFATACGGKGANQAYAAARMCAAPNQVQMIGCVGNDGPAEIMLGSLRSAGANVDEVLRRADVASGIAMILVEDGGQNEIIIASGANMTLTVDEVRAKAELLQQSQALVLQLEVPMPCVHEALRIARAAGVSTVLNPAPFNPLVREFLPLCDVVIPNETEAQQLCGVPVTDLASAQAAAQAIQAMGAKDVIVTLGGQGAWLQMAEWVGHVPTLPVQPVDTTAAGDTFIGAFVARRGEGVGVREAARFACAAAAISVTRHGAQPSVPTRAEVLAALYEVKT